MHLMYGSDNINYRIGIYIRLSREDGDDLESESVSNQRSLLMDFLLSNNLTLVDDTDIYIGDSVMLGPNVVLATAGHPVDPELRRLVYQFNQPIHIGNNVWLGAGVIVLPGVTIGDNSVVGAGSVVTKDIPANVVAVGNPCRILREINEHDREYYWRDFKIVRH